VKRSFIPLFVTNFIGVLNDNFLKTLASFTIIGWLADPKMQSVFMGAVAAALVLPYVLCSPLADRLTVLFPKIRIFRLAKWAEIPIVAIGIAGFFCHSAALVVSAVLLIGVQSSLYSPAKYALVRDVGGADRISTGMGGMEGISFAGVLLGTIAASFAFDLAPVWAQCACLLLFACLGLVASYTLRADEEPNRAVHAINPLRYLRRAHRMARRYPGLNAIIVTLSVFWWAAAMLQMGLLVYGTQAMGLDSTATGGLLCAAAVGIVVGQVVAGLVDRRHGLLGMTPLFGLVAAALLGVLFFVPMGPVPFAAVLSVLAFDLGFFKLPFDAEIQRVVKGPKLNTMLAYFNQVSFLFMMGASLCYMGVSALFGPRAFLLLLAVVMAVVPLLFIFFYRSVLCRVGKWALARRYAVTIKGLETLKQTTGVLVLPNHPALVDPMLVVTHLHKLPLHPLVDELFFESGGLAARVLKTLGCVKVPDLRKNRSAAGARIVRGLQDVVTDALARGEDVLLYPSGHIQTEPREEIGTRQLAYNLCKALPPGVRVVAVRTTGLWGSIWSRKGRTKSPSFAPTLLKSLVYWFFLTPFMPRRRVTMQLEDITDRAKAWSELARLDFNHHLEDWYNETEEKALSL